MNRYDQLRFALHFFLMFFYVFSGVLVLPIFMVTWPCMLLWRLRDKYPAWLNVYLDHCLQLSTKHANVLKALTGQSSEDQMPVLQETLDGQTGVV